MSQCNDHNQCGKISIVHASLEQDRAGSHAVDSNLNGIANLKNGSGGGCYHA